MSELTFTVNNKEISHKDLNTVRDFFTDEQWDCIYDAVSEYKDFPEKEEITRETLHVISQVFTTSYQEKLTMSSLHHEAILETIYEELMEELTLTETLPMYSENEIIQIVDQRFEDMCQQVTSSSFFLSH